MRNYSDEEIDSYISSGDPLDKAGAYAIQNRSFNPVPDFNDCFANVMGLPLCDLYLLMKAMGVEANIKVAEHCQEFLEYNCPVYKKRLSSTSG
jgi:predicted house-cleaning NTP pyrophosphatase (Maf/HAM1 superfamily)